MQLYIVRHAQSSNNALADERLRVQDPPLTGLGWRQAELTAQYLLDALGRAGDEGATGPGINRLFCSAMLRALQTAQVIGRALGLSPEVWVDLHEHGGIWLNHGDGRGIVGYGGITRAHLQAAFPGYIIPDNLTDTGWWRGGHESVEACATRAGRVAATLRAWTPDTDRIAIITHGDFTSYLLNALLGAPQTTSFHQENCGIALVSFRGNARLSIRYLNRLDHLPPEMIT